MMVCILPRGLGKSTLTFKPRGYDTSNLQLNHARSKQLTTGSVNQQRWEVWAQRGGMTGCMFYLFLPFRHHSYHWKFSWAYILLSNILPHILPIYCNMHRLLLLASELVNFEVLWVNNIFFAQNCPVTSLPAWSLLSYSLIHLTSLKSPNALFNLLLCCCDRHTVTKTPAHLEINQPEILRWQHESGLSISFEKRVHTWQRQPHESIMSIS